MAKGTNRDAGREATWRRIIREHGRNGLTIRQFCRDNALTESTFYFWRQVAAPAFVPVSISRQARSQAAGTEIVLPGGVRVYVVPGQGFGFPK